MDWKFWKKKKQEAKIKRTETKTQSVSTVTSRNVTNPGIYYQKGLAGTEIISVTGWNPDQTLDISKIPEEQRKKLQRIPNHNEIIVRIMIQNEN